MRKWRCLFFACFVMDNVWAHGEDKPGPHGGYIKMPADFHTELVPESDGSVRVYLLDISFQNPTLQAGSSVEVSLEKQEPSMKWNCQPMNGDHFHCQPSKAGKLDHGQLLVKAKREKLTGEAVYALPLKSFNQEVDHASHHKN